MKRVVHITTRFLRGGSERTLADVVRALPASDYDQIVIVGRDRDPASLQALIGNTETLPIESLVRRPGPLMDPKAFADLRLALRRLKPDIVHTIQSKAGVVGRTAARSAGVPAIVHSVVMSNFGPGFNRAESLAYRSAERLVASWTDRYIACGVDVRDTFVRGGISTGDRYSIVRSSVDAEGIGAVASAGQSVARGALGIDHDRPIVLFAGSLESRKGVRDLVPFLTHLRLLVPNAELVIAGDGPLRGELEGALHESGLLAAVRFLGYTHRMAEAMVAADCLVMLSRAEGLATVLVQAIAARRRFVSYPVDGPREMIARGAVGLVLSEPAASAAAEAAARQLQLRGDMVPAIDLSEWNPDVVADRYRAEFARFSG